MTSFPHWGVTIPWWGRGEGFACEAYSGANLYYSLNQMMVVWGYLGVCVWVGV
jgi:hypothetical protein